MKTLFCAACENFSRLKVLLRFTCVSCSHENKHCFEQSTGTRISDHRVLARMRGRFLRATRGDDYSFGRGRRLPWFRRREDNLRPCHVMKFRTAKTLTAMITPHLNSPCATSRPKSKKISVVWQKGQAWMLKPRVSSRPAAISFLFKILCAMAMLASSVSPIQSTAADVTVYDSIVSLVTNGTKNYTFVDPTSGQSVTIAVTMSPFSGDPAAVFSILDGGIRVGVGNPAIAGDGNLIALGEGVDFSAMLVSSSSGATASSVQFRIAGLGLRAVDGAPHQYWASSAAASNAFTLSGEIVYGLDNFVAPIYAGSYSGQLRFV